MSAKNKLKKPENKPNLEAKQVAFLELYLDPHSSTFGNAYRSAKAVGYSENYANQITGVKPKWLTEYNRLNHLSLDHINQTLTELASFQRKIESKSPDDTRLKALELISKLNGYLVERKQIAQVVKVELGEVNRYKPEQEPNR